MTETRADNLETCRPDSYYRLFEITKSTRFLTEGVTMFSKLFVAFFERILNHCFFPRSIFSLEKSLMENLES